jgi:hypothetical protein
VDPQDIAGAADVDEAPSQRRDERANQGLHVSQGALRDRDRRGQTQESRRVAADLVRQSHWGRGRWVAARLARGLADMRPALQAEAGAAAGRQA